MECTSNCCELWWEGAWDWERLLFYNDTFRYESVRQDSLTIVVEFHASFIQNSTQTGNTAKIWTRRSCVKPLIVGLSAHEGTTRHSSGEKLPPTREKIIALILEPPGIPTLCVYGKNSVFSQKTSSTTVFHFHHLSSKAPEPWLLQLEFPPWGGKRETVLQILKLLYHNWN